MTERGMIFNSEMVRAILDGRKTQTRRIMAPQPADDIERGIFPNPEAIGWKSSLRHKHGSTTAHFCPYGKPGDRIWVRETFQGPLFDYDLMDSYCKDPTPFEKPEFCVYKADGVPAPEFYDADDELHCCWRPSIHMPRWASRILLEITDVRVERLNAISPEDAESEGLERTNFTGFGDEPGLPSYPEPDVYFDPLKKQWKEYPPEAFAGLWESIYGEGSWQANPWVWVIEFKRVEGGAA
ncbi:hypothetical protein JMW42_06790 [Klebsiella pneumoniae]|nr:hypothetical protein JMW42_06790 [Klebsiella pneumoniae]